jgi:hypothetical protein
MLCECVLLFVYLSNQWVELFARGCICLACLRFVYVCLGGFSMCLCVDLVNIRCMNMSTSASRW